MMIDIVWIMDNILIDYFDRFFYSIVIAVMDYHGNCTAENNLLIQLRYQYEFLLELAVNMSLETDKNVRTYDNCLSVCYSFDITDDNRTSNIIHKKKKKKKEKMKNRTIVGISVFYILFSIQKAKLFCKVTWYTLHLNNQQAQCQRNGRNSFIEHDKTEKKRASSSSSSLINDAL